MGLYDRDYMRADYSEGAPKEPDNRAPRRKVIIVVMAIVMILIFVFAYLI